MHTRSVYFLSCLFLVSSPNDAFAGSELSAEQSCDMTAQSAVPEFANASRKTIEATLDKLKEKQSLCYESADYYTAYGNTLLDAGDTKRAQEMLERALLIDPRNLAALIHYTQALLSNGELLAAVQVNQTTLERDDLASDTRTLLLERKAYLESQLVQWRYQLTYLYGYSDNLNNATDRKWFDITLPGLPLPLPILLSSSARAQSGDYNYFAVVADQYRLSSAYTSLTSYSFKARNNDFNSSQYVFTTIEGDGSSETIRTPDNPDILSYEAKVSYEQEREYLSQRINWNLSFEYSKVTKDTDYSSIEAVLKLIPRSENSYLNLETQYKNFNSENQIDEISFNIIPGIIFSYNGHTSGLELDFDFNRSLEERAGGDSVGQKVSIFHALPLFSGRLTSKVSFQRKKDLSGYSYLLSNNAKKTTENVEYSLQYHYPINQDLIIHARYLAKDQSSNIQLFDIESENFDLGFTYRF